MYAYIKPRLSGNILTASVVVITAGVLVFELPPAFERIFELRDVRASRVATSVAVQAGEWLASRYPTCTRILFDVYSYVPPEFADAALAIEFDIARLRTYDPDIVVANDEMRNRYLDPRVAIEYRQGVDVYNGIFDFYRSLEEQKLGYVLARDFGSVRIYEKAAK
jgi:hypothetical protein